MRLVSIVMFSFLVFSISRAQQICPVEVEWAGIKTNHVSSDVRVPEVRVRFRNASGKEIVGIKFGAVFFDAVDEPFEEYVDYMAQPPWESNWGTIKKVGILRRHHQVSLKLHSLPFGAQAQKPPRTQIFMLLR